jgi:hypothetical protein
MYLLSEMHIRVYNGWHIKREAALPRQMMRAFRTHKPMAKESLECVLWGTPGIKVVKLNMVITQCYIRQSHHTFCMITLHWSYWIHRILHWLECYFKYLRSWNNITCHTKDEAVSISNHMYSPWEFLIGERKIKCSFKGCHVRITWQYRVKKCLHTTSI